MDIQDFINAMNVRGYLERGNYHLTIGYLEKLLRLNPRAVVQWEDGKGADYIDSYRGYYNDCAISDAPTPQSASGMLERIEHLKAEGMEGYKGGHYAVSDRTPLWRSEYGDADNVAVISADVADGVITLRTEKIEQ